MTRVIYIMGAGRSGSTLVGVLLGNARDAFFAGELDAYARRDGVPTRNDDQCRQVWDAVRARLDGHGPRPSSDWHMALEHPRSLLRTRRRGNRSAYVEFHDSLYRAVADETNAAFVIDSSHYPLRRWHLRRVPHADIYTLHLVRDPRATVRSLQTDISPKSRWGANAYLWVVHLLSDAVYARLDRPRRLRVRYEDLLANPELWLARLARWCGLDTSQVDLTNLETGTPFAGNRIITRPTVGLRRAPPDGRSTPDRATTWLQLPWLLRYGYLGRREPAGA